MKQQTPIRIFDTSCGMAFAGIITHFHGIATSMTVCFSILFAWGFIEWIFSSNNKLKEKKK